MLNTSRTAEYFDANQCSRINTRSARIYAIFSQYSFCATGMRSVLATRNDPNLSVKRERLGESITYVDLRVPCLFFCNTVRDGYWDTF
jgi:hypothetical protein